MKLRRTGRPRAGITLMEMLVVLALVSLLAGITYPSVTAGLDSLRLSSATSRVVTFFNAAMNRAERRRQVVELTIVPSESLLRLLSTEPGFHRELKLEDGVRIVKVLPELIMADEGPRRFYFHPGGTPPRAGILLRGQRGPARLVRVDPMTGVPRVETLEEP